VERRLAEGKPVEDIGSVASFFVSRVDTKVDKQLDEMVAANTLSVEDAKRLKGKAAIANAKLAYEVYGEVFKSERFKALQAKGAKVQRCLWASTSVKNPEYPDIMYIEELVGPDTVNTIPGSTLEAYADHGSPADRIEQGLEEAKALMSQLEEVGIDMQKVTDELIDEGVKSFENAFDKLLDSIGTKAEGVTAGS
jgi:transaldolase